jgi:serine/threonine-protein kinase
MILIPGGSFTLGSSTGPAEPNEGPVLSLTLPPFWIDRTEVPVGVYRQCVLDHRCPPPAPPSSRRCTWGLGNNNLPINCVSHQEALQFCLAHGKRLPSEAEWELAARGFSSAPFPWGQEKPSCDRAISRKGNSASDGCVEGPAPVGERARGKSPFGVLDLAGNVEEWVADGYDDRLPPAERPTASWVLRGGSWASPWNHLRVTHRSWASSVERGPTVGFRCAATPPL